jgi:hypothetical protein
MQPARHDHEQQYEDDDRGLARGQARHSHQVRHHLGGVNWQQEASALA